ncbi:hypothetical protein [Paraburkholderia humisilvae]|uniref:Uncharacterized protein n=1 Tax=Paraburkholderia humisilvae TaxID=627669 RepID=A0A6J5DK26_9BURK|nr:hypothetical protein [Paraburkholderia humisilvae]CAB3754293.1 hypothetical protein LMG29542_02305 [Paraburkholderia humisilvae]
MQIRTDTCPAQRWRLGRDYWRVDRDEGFRKQDYAVDLISDSIAKRFVVENHYSASYPAAVVRVGLFHGTELVGVCVFSVPMNNAAIPKYTGLAPSAGVELGRFLLLDSVVRNGESFFIKKAFAALRKARPQVKGVVAYSDPVPRHTADGRIVMPGHVGTIYQAGNARYVGRSASRILHLSASGHALSPRAISKIRRQEQGAQGAEKNLVRLGAPQRRFGQDPAEWLDEVLSSGAFVRLRHPGNHCYVFSLGRPQEKRLLERTFAVARPYPKLLDPQQQALSLAVKPAFHQPPKSNPDWA